MSGDTQLPPIRHAGRPSCSPRDNAQPNSNPTPADDDKGSAQALSFQRQSSVPDVYLGSKNHPEEEDELFGLRKMLRILADEDQHNEKLIHALNVLLAMSMVEGSLVKMVDRGVLATVYKMLQHFGDLAHLFSFDQIATTEATHDNNLTTPAEEPPSTERAPSGARLEDLIRKEEHHVRGDYYPSGRSRPPLFPEVVRPAKEEPFFESLDDGKLRALPRPPSWVSQTSSAGFSDAAGESQAFPPVRDFAAVQHDSIHHVHTPTSGRRSTPARSPGGSPLLGSPIHGIAGARRKEKVRVPDHPVLSPEANICEKYGKPKYKKPEKVKYPPPSGEEVLETSLKIIFNLSKVCGSHRHIVLPSRLRLLLHVTAPASRFSVRLLGLRILVNLTSSRRTHEDIVKSPGLLSSIAAGLIEEDDNQDKADPERGSEPDTAEEGFASSPDVTSPRSEKTSSSAGVYHRTVSESDAGESKKPEACKEGEIQLKAIWIICNLSANNEMVQERYRLPCLLRLRLMDQKTLDSLADGHGIDKFSYRRHELELLLASRRRVNIRETLWAQSDVVKALLETVLHGSHKFRHLVLTMFINFSCDENISVEMVEGDIKMMEPLISLLAGFLAPMHDVLAEEEIEVVLEEDEPTPDPRFLPKVQNLFKERFQSIFEMWVFFDRHDNWSVSVDDVKELSKQLLPEASGVKLAEIGLVMDFKKQKFVDPHDIIREISWHELPGNVKVVTETDSPGAPAQEGAVSAFARAVQQSKCSLPASQSVLWSRELEEARGRKSKILSQLNHKMKKLKEQFLKQKTAAKERARKDRMAARQNAGTPQAAAAKVGAGVGTHVVAKSALAEDTAHKAQSPRTEDKDASMSEKLTLQRTVSESTTESVGRAGNLVEATDQGPGASTRVNQLTSPRQAQGDDAQQDSFHDDDHENDDILQEDEDEAYLAARAEQARVKQELAKKKKIQTELDQVFQRYGPEDMVSMEMILAIISNVCKDPETHERLLAELNVIQVIKPLLTMAPGTHYPVRLTAHSILDELGEDFKHDDEAFDEVTLQRLGRVAKKWMNGVLLGAFNSWHEACKLLRVHSVSILECYRRNAAGLLSESIPVLPRLIDSISPSSMMLPAAAGVASKPIQRFLEDRAGDGLWLGDMGLNREAMVMSYISTEAVSLPSYFRIGNLLTFDILLTYKQTALTCAMRGCDIQGTRLGMLDIEELRFREDLVPLAQVDVSVSDIRDEGLECLVDSLLGLKVQLLVLKAARSNLTARSGKILERLLLECNDLEEMRVSGNKLGAVGLRALCKGTRDHPNMIALDISANEIKLPGGEELGALLTTNNVLKEVDVSWNDITGEDGQLLLQGLALNKSVEVFRASWNRLGKAALPYLDDVLNRSKILYELDLRHCGMDQHHAFENSTHTTPRLETPLTFVQNPRPVSVDARDALKEEEAKEIETEKLSRVRSIERKSSLSQHSMSRSNA